jgi:hypothetical protein
MAEMKLSLLQRAERFLAVRMIELERRLPFDGKDSPDWAEYVQIADTLVRIRAQLYPPMPRDLAEFLQMARPRMPRTPKRTIAVEPEAK